MNRRSVIIFCCVIFCIGTGTLGAVLWQDNKPRRITRVKRPVFTEKDWDGVYFEDLFEEGLDGERPNDSAGQLAVSARPEGQPGLSPVRPDTVAPTGATGVQEGEFAWSQVLSRDVIEDEVKLLQQTLQADVTTPGKFKSDYRKARQSFSILSMLFAVIRLYDNDDVRWKDSSAMAQASFQRAAANARVGSEQSYQSAKARLQDLTDMVRGGGFAGQETVAEEIDWGQVVDRSPLMRRLEDMRTIVKPMLSSGREFKSNIESVRHEASMVAAIGYVLADENSDDGDDESYAELAISMATAARALAEACESEDYSAAEEAYNLIDNSCQDCHADWR